MVAGSSSRPAGASSSVTVYEPPVQPVASPSFAVDLNGSGGGEVGIGDYVPTPLQCAAPAGLGDALLDDPVDDDVEPNIIADDIVDDIGPSEPTGAGGGSPLNPTPIRNVINKVHVRNSPDTPLRRLHRNRNESQIPQVHLW
ncbi:hypothetical protein Ahy_A03g011656 [Arachis hypogaea]|uniref:Uncharacterized protein n=1 Tax=Arachis hypogaea TaxID=3818 RepID=A0A445DRD0_ARAHY|nr:hypothetical protein Ahy_A03g011656 [Arachis hypogaea]